jgi:hypothetical protein
LDLRLCSGERRMLCLCKRHLRLRWELWSVVIDGDLTSTHLSRQLLLWREGSSGVTAECTARQVASGGMLPRLLLQLVLPEQGLSEGRDVRLASCQQGSALKDQRSYLDSIRTGGSRSILHPVNGNQPPLGNLHCPLRRRVPHYGTGTRKMVRRSP